MTLLHVDTSELQRALDNATNIDWAKLTEELAEGINDWKSRMTTGEDPWHKGYRVEKKDGSGLSSYYVKPDHKGARLSARSSRGWKTRQRGISAVAFNDARDKIGGTFYARYVRKPNTTYTEVDDLGPEAQKAFRYFEEEMTAAAERMAASLEANMTNGG